MRVKTIVTLFGVGMLLSALLPATSMAIPAWARKYGASCNLCHYPNVPRLNSYGERFRRAGFRTEGEINKEQDVTKVGNFLSVRGRPIYQATFKDVGVFTADRSKRFSNGFNLSDATIFYSGAVSKHFSAFTETEVTGNGEVELLATAHGILGEWGNYATARMGQMHTLTRVGFGGLDRPSAITGSAILGNRLTLSPIPFKLNEDQRGLELAYVFQDSRVMAQVLNGVDSTGDGRPKGVNDNDQDKDVVLAFEQIIDDIASGFTVFGYKGAVHVPTTAGPPTRFSFWRYGVTGNKVVDLGPINFEVIGGYVRSDDDVPSGNAFNNGHDVSGNAFFVELEQNLKDLEFTLIERYDYINPQVGHGDDETQYGTIGIVAPLEEYVRVALEGVLVNRTVAQPDHDTNDYGLRAEVMFNF